MYGERWILWFDDAEDMKSGLLVSPQAHSQPASKREETWMALVSKEIASTVLSGADAASEDISRPSEEKQRPAQSHNKQQQHTKSKR